MALLNFFKPKWQQRNPEVRIAAIQNFKKPESKTLAGIILNDDDFKVKLAALAKLDELGELNKLVKTVKDSGLKDCIEDKINQLLVKSILDGHGELNPQQYLDQLDNEVLLAEVATKALSAEIRQQAIEKIRDQKLLCTVMCSNCGKKVAETALAKISNLEILDVAAKKASNKRIRSLAIEKIAQIKGPDQAQLQAEIERRLQPFIEQVEQLVTFTDPETAITRLVKLEQKWHDAGEKDQTSCYTFESAAGDVRKRWRDFQQHQKEIKVKQERSEQVKAELEDLHKKMTPLVESTAEGEEAHFADLSEQWQKIALSLDCSDLNDQKAIFNGIREKFQHSRHVISNERKILISFEKQWAKISEKVENNNMAEVSSLLDKIEIDIQKHLLSFLSVSDLIEQVHGVRKQYNKYQEQQKEAEQKEKEDNFALRLDFIREVKELIHCEDHVGAKKRFKEISNKWAQPCLLPDNCDEINKQFEQAAKSFQKEQEAHFKEKEWKRWANKNAKEELIKNLEGLEQEKDLYLVFKKLKTLQTQWSQIGPVPQKDSHTLWRRYSKIADRNFKKCQHFFAQQDELAEDNLIKKQALVALAEECRLSEQWTKSAELLKKKQAEWKTIGRAPKEKEAELFAQFRGACDCFFQRRQAHYLQLDKKRQKSLLEKEQLANEVEQLAAKPLRENSKQILELQKKWKNLGPAPKDKEQQVWRRFRTSCDRFFACLDELRPQNLIQKEDLCQQVEELCLTLDDDFGNLSNISSKISQLQKQWKKIGPVPENYKDDVWERFKGTCDRFFEKKRCYLQQRDRLRPENEARKQQILQEVRGLVDKDDKKSASRIVQLQDEWKEIGPALPNHESIIQQEFYEICNSFFKGKRQDYQERDRLRHHNLKKKEELCLRLEVIGGLQSQQIKKVTKVSSSLTLAEQLKLAFEENFVMGGNRDSLTRRKKDELRQIQKEWQTIGNVPKKDEQGIKLRYQAALKSCYSKEKRKLL